jgi:hypothetical protein
VALWDPLRRADGKPPSPRADIEDPFVAAPHETIEKPAPLRELPKGDVAYPESCWDGGERGQRPEK